MTTASAAARTAALWERAQRLIPGGFHTYSKGDDQFPQNAPKLIERASGYTCWDPDGGAWLDWGMGLRSVVLGHAYEPVLEAVRQQLSRGSNFTRPSPLEGELAETIARIIPCAEMVKFAKTGSDVTTAAVRMARAFTGRDRVAICRDNPYYSFDDWFIGTTVCPAGVPEATRQLSHTFAYGDREGVAQLFAAHGRELACLIIEPLMTTPFVQDRGCARCARDGSCAARRQECESGAFLQWLVESARRHGILVIFDEMITGFRWDLGGAQRLLGVTPDIATFGKAIGNGFSLGVLAGRAEILVRGGIRPGDERVFLLSSTHGGETHSLAAALATIHELETKPVIPHIWRIGQRLITGINAIARRHGIERSLWCHGYPCSPLVVTADATGAPSAAFRTLWLSELIQRGILMPFLAPSFAHDDEAVDRTLAAVDALAPAYKAGLEHGVRESEVGPFVKPVFRKWN